MTTQTSPIERFHHALGGRRAWLWAALVLAILAAGAGAWWRWLAAPSPQSLYITAGVQRGNIENTISALGTLQPRDYVDVGTQVSGQLRKIVVPVGAVVHQGDLLAQIDPTVYQSRVEGDKAQLLNLRAQLADREAQLVLARQQYARQQNLMKARATSTDALQSARAAQKSAAAQVEALKAQIQNVESTLKGDEANLGYTKIIAPMSGTVVSETAKQGQTLNANQQAPIILRIADLSTMTVWTQVSEADVGKLHVGMDVYFTTLGRPDKKWQAKLGEILPTPEIVNNVVLYDALFDIPNPTGELMTQMTAQVFFVLAKADDALLVPVSALQPVRSGGRRATGGGTAPQNGEKPGESSAAGVASTSRAVVRVLTPDGTLERRVVEVGVRNRVSAQILNGLHDGERVVVGTRRDTTAGNSSGNRVRRPRL